MAFSEYLASSVLNWMRDTAFPTDLTNIYISVHTGSPGANGSANNVTSTIASGGRATLAAANLNAPSNVSDGFQISNTAAVTLTSSATNAPSPTGVTLTHFGIWDSQAGGNFLGFGALSQSVKIFTGDTVQFAIGALVVRVV